MRRRPIIALLSDFGTQDWYVSVMKAVLLARCPSAQLVDISHEVPPHAISTGAFILAAAMDWFPKGTVFLGVVDPGVGSARQGIAVSINGRFCVGPDNGLFAACLQDQKIEQAVSLTKPRYWLKNISHTFHGRDLFAPVAAHLALGKPLSVLGKRIRRIKKLTPQTAKPKPNSGLLTGRIVYIDRFGNLITDVSAKQIAKRYSKQVLIRYKGRSVAVVSSYAFIKKRNQLCALINSAGRVELVLREQSAAKVFRAKIGDAIRYRLR